MCYEDPLNPLFTVVAEKIATPMAMENIINLLASREVIFNVA